MSYYPEQDSHNRETGNIELDLSHYATKSVVKQATVVGTLDFAKKTDLSSLKSKLNKLDVDKLGTFLQT